MYEVITRTERVAARDKETAVRLAKRSKEQAAIFCNGVFVIYVYKHIVTVVA